jgi:hypothetical protein
MLITGIVGRRTLAVYRNKALRFKLYALSLKIICIKPINFFVRKNNGFICLNFCLRNRV